MASVIFFQRSVYCQGIMSSSQAMLYFCSALPSLMQELTPMWPKWSAESGTSMPMISRTWRDVVGHHGDALVGDLDAGEHVLRVERLAIGLAQRPAERAGRVAEQVDPQIHLEPGEALVLAQLQALAVHLRIVRFGGVGVAADLVAELAAEHLVDRHVVGFAGQIPQRHLDAADAAGLPRVQRRTA